jgi:hypothetical protein
MSVHKIEWLNNQAVILGIVQKTIFFGVLLLLLPWWVGLSVFGCWFIIKSLLWFMEAHGPLYSEPSLRGFRMYLRFLMG